MAKPKLVNKPREVDIGTEASELAEELSAARILGISRPTDDELIDVLNRVQDHTEVECEKCSDAHKHSEAFIDDVGASDPAPSLSALCRLLQVTSEITDDAAGDAVREFEKDIMYSRAIKWVAERAADMGRPDLAAEILKLETM